MFWRFGGYANISTIDTLLDKPDVTLEELLNEPELISELSQHNTKLIEFLREDHILKRLMEYVIAPPLFEENEFEEEEEEDQKKAPAGKSGSTDTAGEPPEEILKPEDKEKAEEQRSTYAYVACEILSSETWSIIESILLNQDDLRNFWSFVRRPAPLNSRQSGYFTKVNEVLFEKKTKQMLDFFKSLDGIVPAILQHVDNPMIMDLLLKIITLEKVEGGQGIVDWLKKENLIPILLSYLAPEHPASVQTSAGDFLKAIITISANATQNDETCIGPNNLTRQLVSAACVEQLIGYMLQGGNSLTVGVGIVIEVIRKNNSDYDPENVGGPDAPPTPYDPIYLGTLLRKFSDRIPDFMALMLSPKHSVVENGKVKLVDRPVFNSTWGTKIEPLSFDRFKTCELLAELLHCSNMRLLNEVGSEEYIRRRDAERERLQAEGVLGASQDESGVDLGGSAGFENGQGQSRPHGATGDDDGFEDVGSSGILVGATNAAEPAADVTVRQEKPADVQTSKQHQDSPISSTTEGAQAEHSASSGVATQQTSDMISHAASALTDKVGQIKINNDEQGPRGQDTTPADARADENLSSQAPVPADQVLQASGDVPPAEGSEVPTIGEFTPEIQYEANGEPVVGDYLKIMFIEHKVVPTILDFFFRFPWNNFLHNVVYDVVQQVFNGPIDRGFNRSLAIDVFVTGRITEQIVEGQRRSDEAQTNKNMRLGYMGHLTLIAEEVVKFTGRHPPEVLSQAVMDRVLQPDWVHYVEHTLSETRERDNAVLGGERPERDSGLSTSQGLTGSTALANAGLNGGSGGGFEGFDYMNYGSVSSGAFGGGSNSMLSGFGSSSDDEDEDMEDHDDEEARGANDNTAEGGSDNDDNSSQAIPILPPPPNPASGPSRARRQLAARLALHQSQAESSQQNSASQGQGDDEQWQSNPFIIAGVEDEGDSSPSFPSTDFGPDAVSSPTFPRTGFTPPESPSNSSDSAGHEIPQAKPRKERIPLEIDDDDEEMGEMVGPSMGSEVMDSDEEEEAIINESLGYSSFFGPGRYGGLGRSYSKDSSHSFLDDEAEDSSDGEEEEGLVEIQVPGKKTPTTSSSQGV